MTIEEIELLNKILKITFEFGWEVGASWDTDHYKDLVDINGYLKHDQKITAELNNSIKDLLTKLGHNPNEFIIYTKEDCSIHENDWNYIAPSISSIEK